MGEILNYIVEVFEFLPTNVYMSGLVLYLMWFNKRYEKRHQEVRDQGKKNKDCIEKNAKVDNEMLLLILKGLITNDNLPNFVRMDFYKDYKKHKGNSWVDNYVKENVLYEGRKYGRRYDDDAEYVFDPDKENGHSHYKKEREEPN